MKTLNLEQMETVQGGVRAEQQQGCAWGFVSLGLSIVGGVIGIASVAGTAFSIMAIGASFISLGESGCM